MSRIETDLLGKREIPADAYWGIHTSRALENFPLSGQSTHPGLIRALAMVKKACCLANSEIGALDPTKSGAIIYACDEIVGGGLAEQFPIDALQGGAGTSTNMNMNEVIANRAIERLGGTKGDYELIHSLEDVNLHQSTNDVYPTAVKIAAIFGLRALNPAVAELQGAFQDKEKAFGAIIKIGRTELQDAVPMTLGAEFSAFAEAISRDRWRTFKCEERLRVVNLGGTAVGTGLTAPRDYIFLVTEKLREVTGLGLARGDNLVGETANADPFVEVSGILKAHAANLIKIAGDLRLLHLLGEIRLPDLQAGSSIMPGKVNPVMMEAVIQSGIKVMANDLIITEAVSRGTLQINEFLPLLAHALLESLDLLTAVSRKVALHVRDIKAVEEIARGYAEATPMLVTALLPVIGYDQAMSLIQAFQAEGGGNVRTFLEKRLGTDTIDKVLSPFALTALGHRGHGNNSQGK